MLPFTVRVAALRFRNEPRPNWNLATDIQKQDEVRAAFKKMLEDPERYSDGAYNSKKNDGDRYTVLGYESDATYLWDSTKPIGVKIRRTNIYDTEKPTTDIILERPLRNFALPNAYAFRPFDLHPESFEYYEHGCAVQMIKTSFRTKWVSGAQKKKPKEQRNPKNEMFTVKQIQNDMEEIYIELGYEDGEYPFENDWRMDGPNGHMVKEFCKKTNPKK